MSIRISLYDFFAYTIPGIFYIMIIVVGLSVFGYISIPYSQLSGISLFSFLFIIFLGYIAGLLIDAFAYRWFSIFYGKGNEVRTNVFIYFRKLHPYVELNLDPGDWPIMLQAIKSKSIEAATDIESHNVASIMLRNISFGFAWIVLLFILYFIFKDRYFVNLLLAIIAIVLSYIALRRSKDRRKWFYMGICEAYSAIFLLDTKTSRSVDKDVVDEKVKKTKRSTLLNNISK